MSAISANLQLYDLALQRVEDLFVSATPAADTREIEAALPFHTLVGSVGKPLPGRFEPAVPF